MPTINPMLCEVEKRPSNLVVIKKTRLNQEKYSLGDARLINDDLETEILLSRDRLYSAPTPKCVKVRSRELHIPLKQIETSP